MKMHITSSKYIRTYVCNNFVRHICIHSVTDFFRFFDEYFNTISTLLGCVLCLYTYKYTILCINK